MDIDTKNLVRIKTASELHSMEPLISFRKNVFSQNGEDGIIARIFSAMEVKRGLCCEFGAWDGIHFSNTRRLIVEESWPAVLIESDPARYRALVKTYEGVDVICVCRQVDVANNRLEKILEEVKIEREPDFLSIDVDGLDYEIFQSLEIRPRVVCVEVNGGHSPVSTRLIPRDTAMHNVGQPLTQFCHIADKKGYDLVCYTGNAFFVRRESCPYDELPALSLEEAYEQYLAALSADLREWLYLVNVGKVSPFYAFGNPYATRRALRISRIRAVLLQAISIRYSLRHRIKKLYFK